MTGRPIGDLGTMQPAVRKVEFITCSGRYCTEGSQRTKPLGFGVPWKLIDAPILFIENVFETVEFFITGQELNWIGDRVPPRVLQQNAVQSVTEEE